MKGEINPVFHPLNVATLLLVIAFIQICIYNSDDETFKRNEKELRKTESAVTYKENGHDYVDLGLSVKWATKNLGDLNGTRQCGDYLYYEDITPDVAKEKWGGSWRLPTEAEWQELIAKCDWKWLDPGYGGPGYEIRNIQTGKSIYLPISGSRNEQGSCSGHYGEKGYGLYWSSTSSNQGSQICLRFDYDRYIRLYNYNYMHDKSGLQVRAVCD